MSTTEPGYQDIEAAAAAHELDVPAELRSLLKTISTQIDDVDQRHTGLLQDLRERLGALSRAAGTVRDSVPAGAAPVYQRIEHGLAGLAQKIDAMDEGAGVPPVNLGFDAPAALRSAATSALPPVRAASTAGIDPFDLVGDDNEAPWGAVDAEALTRIYEESDAALVRTSPRSPTSQPSATPDTMPDTVAAKPTSVPPAFDVLDAASSMKPDAGVHRAWLDQRLSDIARRVEQSITDLRGDFSVDSFGLRFEQFEERMGSVLGDVAMRTDVESLRHLESQFQDLAAHLEQTEQQLGRLDGIEQQLQAVIDHLSSNTATRVAGDSSLSAAVPDLKSLASSTAEEVAERLAARLGNDGRDTRIDDLGSLLRSMIHDRRHSDEQTFTMLDTVQQAMIRLLDRIDALELAQANVPAREHFGATSSVDTPPVFQDFGAPDHAETAPVRVPRQSDFAAPPSVVPAATMTPATALVPPPLTGVSPAIDKLRQDFVADAQRAKMRAASAAPEMDAGPALSAAANRAARGLPRATVPPSAPEVPAAVSSLRKPRLTALALCLVIAVSGAALLAKSRNSGPASTTPAAVTQTQTSEPVAGADAQSAGDAAGDMVIDVPAAPKAAEPSPTTGEGPGFELPQDEQAAVPVPAPVDSGSPDGAGSAGPQTNLEAPGLEGDTSSGAGERLEKQSQADVVQQTPGQTPHGIVLQDGGRQPSAQEIVHLQSQQNFAALSSRLGSNASRLSPADLMPEEVARQSAKAISANTTETAAIKATPASLAVAAMPGETIDIPATGNAKTFSQLSLPPATVGPLSLRMAAANGDPSAAFEVGARLAEGKGTPQNFHEAIIWYQKSASQGFAQSQYRLGTLYERGLGVKADLARAQMWYQRAAEQGHVKAMHNLAVLSAGRGSGHPDYTTAATWFGKAAEYGLADSQFNLAVLHENGLGVAKDPVRALKWYSLAGQGGDAEALRRRDALKSQVTADQRFAADRDVASFEAKRTVSLVNDARVAGEDWKKRQDG